MMKKASNKSLESDDDMDDLPLKYVSSSQKKYSCLKELKSHKIHACEFCERKFNNSYDYLIHNSKHIIIPLIKMLPHFCSECREYFISDEEMNDHKADKHKNIVIPRGHNNVTAETNMSLKISKIETDDDIEIIEDLQEDPLSSICRKKIEKPVVNNNVRKDNVLENFVMNCKVDIEKIDTPWLHQSNVNTVQYNNTDGGVNNVLEIVNIEDDTISNSNSKQGEIIPIVESIPVAFGVNNKVIDKDKIEYNNKVAQFKRLAQEFKTNNYEGEFKNYLMQSLIRKPYLKHNVITIVEDIENHVVQIDSSAKQNNSVNCHVDNIDVIEDDHDVFSDALQFEDEEDEYDDADPIIIIAPLKEKMINNYSSVHFDELMKSGIFQCKRCFQSYSTRYELIIHEVVHLDMSRAYLKRIKMKEKSKEHASTSTIDIDPDYMKSIISYQDTIFDGRLNSRNDSGFYCYKCGRSFNDSKVLKSHSDVCDGEATVTLCDPCLYFRERPTSIVFYSISRLEEQEGKRQCHWCGQFTSEISLLTVKTKRPRHNKKLADRIRFESNADKHKRIEKGFRQVVNRGGGSNRRVQGRGCARGTNNNSRHFAKPLTNRERLKLIQTRLKLMKK